MATICITGPNRGIGLELARQYRNRGDDVLAVVRVPTPEISATGAEIFSGVDVSNDQSVARLAKELEGRKIDVLINNAGIFRDRNGLAEMSVEAVREEIEVNTMGPLVVGQALSPLIADGGKLAIVSSNLGSIENAARASGYGYNISKAGVNMVGKMLSLELAPRKIAVLLLHPGWVSTDMTSHEGPVSAPESASGLIREIDALSMETTASFRSWEGKDLPW
ncbi:MAG: SDR family oxidoreductase [Alphaproteobacteria bacterium]|nr:SDR family oxidoreductase [Alphaproteobacteria bacterium]